MVVTVPSTLTATLEGMEVLASMSVPTSLCTIPVPSLVAVAVVVQEAAGLSTGLVWLAVAVVVAALQALEVAGLLLVTLRPPLALALAVAGQGVLAVLAVLLVNLVPLAVPVTTVVKGARVALLALRW